MCAIRCKGLLASVCLSVCKTGGMEEANIRQPQNIHRCAVFEHLSSLLHTLVVDMAGWLGWSSCPENPAEKKNAVKTTDLQITVASIWGACYTSMQLNLLQFLCTVPLLSLSPPVGHTWSSDLIWKGLLSCLHCQEAFYEARFDLVDHQYIVAYDCFSSSKRPV